MKYFIVFISLIISIFLIFSNCSRQDDFPGLKEPYLDQKPPGLMPEFFAPGIVSTGADEFGSTISPDGKELYFAINGVHYTTIAFTKFENNRWTRPEVAPFSGIYGDWDLNFSPDGKKLYFTSNRPFSGIGSRIDNGNLWVVERTGTGWSKPKSISTLINTDGYENYPSVTKNGTLYYFHSEKGDNNNSDIYYSNLVEGKYEKPIRLGDAINSSYEEWDPFIASDESYIIFCSVNRPDGFGDSDLYISFRKKDSSWTKAVNMGEKINSSAREICPSITPDGKYLFFTSTKKFTEKSNSKKQKSYTEIMREINSPGNGKGDIYWVSAKVIERFRTKEYK